jgi:iron-sulfur cluster assembly protein
MATLIEVETQTTGVTLTQAAADTVKELIAQQEQGDLALRVYVAGGGCSGLQYGMALDENIEQDDQIFESLGVRIAIDPMSYRYLQGSSIDYITSGVSGGFKVNNPNATGGCGSGCGCHH